MARTRNLRVATAAGVAQVQSSPMREDPAGPGSPAKRGSQNYSTFVSRYTQPRADSGLKLGPGAYTLNCLGSVPFVKFKGGARQEKVISWGEVCIVPEGQIVSVWNDSWHPGEIVVNGGSDIATKPTRITVPVPLVAVSGDAPAVLSPQFPVDARRARTAWLVITGQVGLVQMTIQKIGLVKSRFNNVTSSNQPSGYASNENFAPGTLITYIALGYGSDSAEESRPHALLDVATISGFDSSVLGGFVSNAYYVLEY